MRTAVRIWALSLALLTLASCAGWRVVYLKSAVNKATQRDVIATLGLPDSTEELVIGGTAWVYLIGPREACTKYIVIFDRDKVLRDWRREGC